MHPVPVPDTLDACQREAITLHMATCGLTTATEEQRARYAALESRISELRPPELPTTHRKRSKRGRKSRGRTVGVSARLSARLAEAVRRRPRSVTLADVIEAGAVALQLYTPQS